MQIYEIILTPQNIIFNEMKIIKILYALLLLIAVQGYAQVQSREVSGVVRDAEGSGRKLKKKEASPKGEASFNRNDILE